MWTRADTSHSVEESNLNRQLFFTKRDIGRYKADVIKEVINERFEDVKVEVIKEKVSSNDIEKYFKGVSASIVTADDPVNISKDCQIVANKLKVPIISTGYITNSSIVMLSPKTQKLIKENEMRVMRLPESIMPSYGPTNIELAGYASSLLIQTIIGKIVSFEDKWTNTIFPRQK